MNDIKTPLQILKSQFYEGEYDEIMSYLNEPITLLIIQAMESYAKQCCEEQILRCSERPNGTYYNPNGANVTEYVIESILNTPNVLQKLKRMN